jgi:Uma2 family endonuclease
MSQPEKYVDLSEVVKNLVTEDDEPVDNMFSGKQQRLLVEPLYSSWTPPPAEEGEEHPPESPPESKPGPRPFLAESNVGIFYSVYQPAIVPDMFLSLDITPPAEWNPQEQRSYFLWDFGKPPEVVVEIVSNRQGGELGKKMRQYGRMAVLYYVVFDPWLQLSQDALRVYELGFGWRYRLRPDYQLPEVGLSLKFWSGAYEAWEAEWIRWCDREGNLILTGGERAKQARSRAEQTEGLAEHEAERRRLAEERAERLAARLRELGVEPE